MCREEPGRQGSCHDISPSRQRVDHMIVAQGLTKIYGATPAVDGISFAVEPGRVTRFPRPNGAGKATPMRMIPGPDRPTSGTVTVHGPRYPDPPAPPPGGGAA